MSAAAIRPMYATDGSHPTRWLGTTTQYAIAPLTPPAFSPPPTSVDRAAIACATNPNATVPSATMPSLRDSLNATSAPPAIAT